MASLKSSKPATFARRARGQCSPQACLQCWANPARGIPSCKQALTSLPIHAEYNNLTASSCKDLLTQLLVPGGLHEQAGPAQYIFRTVSGPQPPSSNSSGQAKSGNSSRAGGSAGSSPQGSDDASNDGMPGRVPYSSSEEGIKEDDSLPVRLALGMLAFYRNAMSPLMQPSCRYLPTCSEYSIQSYKRFGVWRGSVLTAWRLLRCSPFGSSGYDPPQWPPPGLAWVYGDRSWEYAPQATVVLGAAFLAWLGNELWAEVTRIL